MSPIEIPKTQRAVVGENFGKDYTVKVVDNYPVPEPKDDEILVRLTSSGVCHSDLSMLLDHWNMKPQVEIPGHEGSGYIVKHGDKVDPKKYPVNTKVGVALVSNPCRDCANCNTQDGEVKCLQSGLHGFHVNGTWCQYMCINSRYVIPIPDGPEQHVVGPILCGGVTVYTALKRADIKAGEWVVITGAGGGLGSMAIQYASALGYRVIAIDTGDEKKQLVAKLGAEHFVDFKTDNVVEKIKEITTIGAHAAILLAPAVATFNQAPFYLRLNGALIFVGLPPLGEMLTIPPQIIVHQRLRLLGSFVGTRVDCIEALDFVGRGKITPSVTVHKMEEIGQILKDMEDGKLTGRAVIDLQ